MSEFEVQCLDKMQSILDFVQRIDEWTQYLIIAVAIVAFGVGYLVGRK